MKRDIGYSTIETCLIEVNNYYKIFTSLSFCDRPIGYIESMKTTYSARKAKLRHDRTESANNTQPEDMSILDHIEKIFEVSQKFGIDECLSWEKRHIDYVIGKLGISPVQVLLFSTLLGKCGDSYISLSDIADSMNCSKIRIIKYINEYKEMEKKKLIRCNSSRGSISYWITSYLCESLLQFNEYRPLKIDNLTISRFFAVLEQIFKEKENGMFSYDSMRTKLLDLIN